MAQLKIENGQGARAQAQPPGRADVKPPNTANASQNRIVVPGQENQGALDAAIGSAPGERRASSRSDEQAVSVFGSTDSKADYGPDYSYRRIRFHKNDEVNPYAEEQDRRYGMDERVSKLIIIAVIMVIAFVLACILPTNVFDTTTRSDRTIGSLAGEVATSFQAFISFFANPTSMYGTYVLTTLVTLLAGAAMGLSGGVYQGAMKNALASPSTLGVMSGGTIGAIVYAVFIAPNLTGTTYQGFISGYAEQLADMSPFEYILELYGAFFASLVGCMGVVALVMIIALVAGRGHVSNASLIIAGQVFSAVISVVLTWIREYFTMVGDPTTVQYLTQSETSTFQGSYDLISVGAFAIPLLICMGIVFAMSSRLSLLAFNDDEARSMGISPIRTRNAMVALCTAITALVVSFCGAVGFVGFMVPHIARRIVGPDFRFLLPACALLGAAMVCVTYYVSELGIPWIAEGSTGVITSVIGCGAFLFMALRQRGSSSGDWL